MLMGKAESHWNQGARTRHDCTGTLKKYYERCKAYAQATKSRLLICTGERQKYENSIM